MILLLAGGTTLEHPLVYESAMEVQGILAEGGFRSAVHRLSAGWSLDSIEAPRPACVILLDSVFAGGSLQESVELRRILSRRGIPYLGPTALGFLVARDKAVTRRLCEAAGVPVARGFLVERTDEAIVPPFGFPAVVKPVFGAGSIGVEVVEGEGSYLHAVAAKVREFGSVLVEELLLGTEITVPVVWHDGRPVALEAAEISTPGRPIYDYLTKFKTLDNDLFIPARLDPATRSRVQELAVICAELVDLPPFCRVDMMVCAEGSRVLEVNAEAVLGKRDFVARCASATGLSLKGLVLEALERVVKCSG